MNLVGDDIILDEWKVCVHHISATTAPSEMRESATWADDSFWCGSLQICLAEGGVVVQLRKELSPVVVAVCHISNHDCVCCPAVDSSRHFVLTSPEESIHVGISFTRRADAVAFQACYSGLKLNLSEERKQPLAALRHIVGPHASNYLLLLQLGGSQDGDVQKAANAYLRGACSKGPPPFDFQLRLPPPPDSNAIHAMWVDMDIPAPATMSGLVCDARETWLRLECHLFPAAAYLDLRALGVTMLSSKDLFTNIAKDDTWWDARFLKLFKEPSAAELQFSLASVPKVTSTPAGSGYGAISAQLGPSQPGCLLSLPRSGGVARAGGLPVPQKSGSASRHVPPTMPGSSLGATEPKSTSRQGVPVIASGSSFKLFASRWNRERSRQCPMCKAAETIVPVLHGYPSQELVTLARRKLVLLAENCGMLGAPWTCIRCRAKWNEYPFATSARPCGGGFVAGGLGGTAASAAVNVEHAIQPILVTTYEMPALIEAPSVENSDDESSTE